MEMGRFYSKVKPNTTRARLAGGGPGPRCWVISLIRFERDPSPSPGPLTPVSCPFTPLPAAAAVQPLHISRGPPPPVCLSRLTRCSWLHSYNGALVPALLRHRRWLPGAHRMPPSAFARHRALPRRTRVYLHGLALGTLQPASGGQPVCAPLRGVAQAGAPTGMSCLVSMPTPAQVQLRGPVLPPA